MTNRREFLHLGVAALSLPIAARGGMSSRMSPPVVEPDPKELPVYKVIFDERFESCSAFANALKRRELPTHAIRGDITDVWFNDLSDQWKKTPVAIAGLTAPGPIFCLEMLARDAGMRVTLRVDHRRRAPDRVEHMVTGPASVIARAAGLGASAEEWPERVAEWVAHYPATVDAAQTRTLQGRIRPASNDPEHLVSWVIAPVAEPPRRP